MRLEEIIRGIAITDRRGRFDVEIAGVTSDSREVKPGYLFIAVRGVERDGHAFIDDAIKAGASAIIAETWPDRDGAPDRSKPNVVLVPSSRRALALTAANFYGQPSRKLVVAGVTGTNGKTTVTYILESIIRAASKNVGVIGTVDCRFDGKSFEIGNTTPDAVVLQEKLAEMVDAGVTHAVMEVSSHALDQQRVTGIHFKVAGFTNLTQDHLDYHKSLDTYFEAKARLFSETLRKSRARGRMAVVNIDDPKGKALLERWGGKALSVSIDPERDADVVALSAEYTLAGTRATVRTSKGVWDLDFSLIGPHNLANVLVAVAMALAMGFSKARITRGVRALERVPGRLERVPNEEGKHIFVDYAHTPDALKRVLGALRPLTKGRLIVVFGCGGDRDQAKRPLMGRQVGEAADLALITNDNPRSEDPTAIAKAIEGALAEAGWSLMSGAPAPKTYKVELDRRSAIRMAIGWMKPEDVMVLAGKGHESHQIIGKMKHRFDDREETRRILAGMPAPPPLKYDDGTAEVEVDQVVDTLELVDADEIIGEADAPEPPVSVTESIELENILEVLTDDSIEEIGTGDLLDSLAIGAASAKEIFASPPVSPAPSGAPLATPAVEPTPPRPEGTNQPEPEKPKT